MDFSSIPQSSKNALASSVKDFRKNDITDLLNDAEEWDDAYKVNRSVLSPRSIFSKYEFTHKAIWCCELIFSNPFSRLVSHGSCLFLGNSHPDHWAFVARGTMGNSIAYFVAQFGKDDYIPKAVELPKNPKNFHGLLVENNKRLAALRVCSTKERSEVWVKPPGLKPTVIEAAIVTTVIGSFAGAAAAGATFLAGGPVLEAMGFAAAATTVGKMAILDSGPFIGPNILTHPGGKLVDPGFNPDNWSTMTERSLKELNDLMFETKCAGKKYNPATNNCQHFAYDLFERAD